MHPLNGALLINKHPGITSFGVIEELQKRLMAQTGAKRRDLPKLGHGGTLDPFATGILPVLSGRAVKLARYFLGATKTYEGVIRFGETTVPGDPTAPISETSPRVPESLEDMRSLAHKLTLQPYLQTPPMHSAKKVDGRPLYELARQGIEIEREPKLCHLHSFEILGYEKPRARFRLVCSSGTYVRTLAQDFAKLLGSVGMLDSLERTSTGIFRLSGAQTVEQIAREPEAHWDELPCWVPFDRLLDGFARAEASRDEAEAIYQGKQNVLFNILKRVEAPQSRNAILPESAPENEFVAIYCTHSLVAVASRQEGHWGLERVFTRE